MACQANACGAAPVNYELCHLGGPAVLERRHVRDRLPQRQRPAPHARHLQVAACYARGVTSTPDRWVRSQRARRWTSASGSCSSGETASSARSKATAVRSRARSSGTPASANERGDRRPRRDARRRAWRATRGGGAGDRVLASAGAIAYAAGAEPAAGKAHAPRREHRRRRQRRDRRESCAALVIGRCSGAAAPSRSRSPTAQRVRRVARSARCAARGAPLDMAAAPHVPVPHVALARVGRPATMVYPASATTIARLAHGEFSDSSLRSR